MLNFELNHIPHRSVKNRSHGITMVMDKGLSTRQAADMIETSANQIDFVKFGFGTSLVSPNLKEKIKLYTEANIKVYLGGTLLEAFIIRNKFEEYIKTIDKYKLTAAEVSDGSIEIPHDEKCKYINILSKNFTVLSEVGSKEEGIIIHPSKWIKMMNAELQAGSSKVIAEARESGTVGIFHRNGSTHVLLVNKITSKVPVENIIWDNSA